MLKPAVVLSLIALLTFGSAIADAAPSKCPVINGKYEMRVERGDVILRYPYALFTRQDGDIFSYTVDRAGNFQVADGVARSYRLGDRLGKVQVSCEENTMIYASWEDGSDRIVRYKVTPLSSSKIKIESSKEERSGIYYKI